MKMNEDTEATPSMLFGWFLERFSNYRRARFFFIIPAALNTALPSPHRVGIFSYLKRVRAELRPAGTGGSREERGWLEG